MRSHTANKEFDITVPDASCGDKMFPHDFPNLGYDISPLFAAKQ